MRHIVRKMNRQETPSLYIGKLAELSGASRKAIRHYENLGLLPPAVRKGNYRVYTERDVFLVHMIKHAQSFGFSLAELRELVAAAANKPRFPLKLANALVVRKRAALRAQIVDIRAGWVNYLLMGTELHRYHHSADPAQAKSYAAVVTLWDLLFGTFYYRPGVVTLRPGVEHPADYPQDREISKVLVLPFK